MKQIKSVLEGVYNDKELRRRIVPLFLGNPGIAKSVQIYDFAKSIGANVVELIASTMQPYEVSGMAIPVHATGKMTIYDFDRLDSLKDGDILFFDEILNGNPVILNACLTLLESRRTISGKALPDIMIIAAANPQGMCPLTPQIKERFVWYNVKFDKQGWIENYMIPKYGITNSIGDKLGSLIAVEDFTGTNFMTGRSIDKALCMIIAGVPTPYKDVIIEILGELVSNDLEIPVQLPDRLLQPKELLPWIELVKFIYNQKNNEAIKE